MQVYRSFCSRLFVVASNMRLTGLSMAIARAAAVADEIVLADTEPSSSATPTAVPGLNAASENEVLYSLLHCDAHTSLYRCDDLRIRD